MHSALSALDLPAVERPAWWNDVPTDRPVVYVTLGSSGRSDLLAVVLRALADRPVTVIAATAGRVKMAEAPANAFVADYLPGEEAAARSAVVICNVLPPVWKVIGSWNATTPGPGEPPAIR